VSETFVVPGRRWRRWLAVPLLALLAVPASFALRAKLSTTTYPVASIRTSGAYQDPGLLQRAWALPVAQRYRPVFASQSNGSTCGPASLGNVLRSLAQQVREPELASKTPGCWFGLCPGGVTLDRLGQLAHAQTTAKVQVIRDLSYDEFKQHLRSSNDPGRRYLINFQRGLLFGQGGGHHSPLAGYLEREDLVLVLDVNGAFGPWLVDSHRLYAAMDSVDSSDGKKRGLLLIESGSP
jgi:hypothetical protein